MYVTVLDQSAYGRSFSIQVGDFDTVLQMKEKIEDFTGISVSQQVLSCEDDLLLDDTGCVQTCLIGIDPQVLLYTLAQCEGLPLPHVTAQLLVKLPKSYCLFPLVMNLSDSVLLLKQTLKQTFDLPVRHDLGLYLCMCGLIELTDDNKSLRDYGVSDGALIDVFIREDLDMVYWPQPLSSSPSMNMPPLAFSPSSTSASMHSPPKLPSSSSGSNKLQIKVLTLCKTRLILEVNPTDKVQVLRDVLEKLQQTEKFELSSDGHFFIHKQNRMEENQSFVWNDVNQGDEIEISKGQSSIEMIATSLSALNTS